MNTQVQPVNPSEIPFNPLLTSHLQYMASFLRARLLGVVSLTNTTSYVTDLKVNSEMGPFCNSSDLMCLQVSGKGRLSVQFDGPRYEQAEIYTGAVFLYPRDVLARLIWDGTAQYMGIAVAPDYLMQCADEISRGDPSRVRLLTTFNFRDALVEQIGQALYGEIQNNSAGGTVYSESLMHTLVLHLLITRSSAARPQLRHERVENLSHQQLHRVIEYIESCLDRSLTLHELAASANMSVSHFRRRFKQTTGLAAHQYIIRQRVERARRLLLSGLFSVAQAAQAAGFADQSHLHRHMKRWLGMTPSDLCSREQNVQNKAQNVQD